MAVSCTSMEYEEFLKQWSDDREFVNVKTSGSTGTPKEIHLLKSDMIKSAEATVRRFGLNAHSVIASLLPMTSIATRMAVVRSIVAGCRYVDMKPSNNFVITEHIDLLSAGPTQADCLISNPEMASLVGAIMMGGAPLSPERREALLACGYDLWESYGMTETCSNVALRHGSDPLFTANPGISFSLDERDCLIIHASGYSFDGIVTNDVAALTSPTSFCWLGRADNVINSGGVKMYPEQIEKMLAPYMDMPFYITGVTDNKWGQAVALVVEGSEIELDMARAIVDRLPDRKTAPKHIFAEEAFQYTSTGKIIRRRR